MKLERLGPTTLLAMLLLISGCSSVRDESIPLGVQIERWLAADQYGRIFQTLERVPSDHPERAELMRRLPEIRKRAHAYERRMAREALDLARKRRWSEAQARYDEALAHYPGSRFLQSERARFLNDRNHYLNWLERRLLYRQGEWLSQALPLQREIAATDPTDPQARRKLHALETESQRTAATLLEQGLDALRQGNLVRAKRSLKLAHALHPSQRSRQALALLEKRLAESRTDTSAPAPARVKERLEQYRSYYREALEREDWLEALAYLDEMRRLAPTDRTLEEEAVRLKARMETQVREAIARGERFYSQGAFEQALQVWLGVRPLAPRNERLNAHIMRVRRVLKNIEALERRHAETPTGLSVPDMPRQGRTSSVRDGQ